MITLLSLEIIFPVRLFPNYSDYCWLIKGVKNANKFLKVEKNLFVYNENNEYTDEILKIYNKQK